MKKLIYVLLTIILAFSLVGCKSKPVPPVPVIVNTDIVCVGSYNIYYGEWSLTGCEGDEIVAGVFWTNKIDGRIFRLGGVPIKGETVIGLYGKCPSSYIEEIFRPEVKE